MRCICPQNNLGLVLQDYGKKREASDAFRAAIRLGGMNHPEPHVFLALALADEGDAARSRASWWDAVDVFAGQDAGSTRGKAKGKGKGEAKAKGKGKTEVKVEEEEEMAAAKAYNSWPLDAPPLDGEGGDEGSADGADSADGVDGGGADGASGGAGGSGGGIVDLLRLCVGVLVGDRDVRVRQKGHSDHQQHEPNSNSNSNNGNSNNNHGNSDGIGGNNNDDDAAPPRTWIAPTDAMAAKACY